MLLQPLMPLGSACDTPSFSALGIGCLPLVSPHHVCSHVCGRRPCEQSGISLSQGQVCPPSQCLQESRHLKLLLPFYILPLLNRAGLRFFIFPLHFTPFSPPI